MKLLVTADLHLTDNPRDQYRMNFMWAFMEIARRKKPDAIVILGDLTEEKDNHGARLVNQVVLMLKAIADIAPLYILMGNHDYHLEGHPFFQFIDLIPGITWVDKPDKHLGCLWLPHTRKYKEDWKHVEFVGHDYIFAHNTFTGAEIGFGRGLEGIPLEVFPDSVRVIAGDVHKPQRLGPVTYVGPPYTVDYGDAYVPRLLYLERFKVVSISVGSHPQKRLVELDGVEELDRAHESVGTGDIVQVRCGVESMENWKSTHDKILEWAAKTGVVAQLIKPVLMQKGKVRRHKITTQADDLDMIEQFGKRMTLSKNTVLVGKKLCDET